MPDFLQFLLQQNVYVKLKRLIFYSLPNKQKQYLIKLFKKILSAQSMCIKI